MIPAVLNYGFAIAILAMLSEIRSTPLIVIGWIMAIWFAVIGSLHGWMSARR